MNSNRVLFVLLAAAVVDGSAWAQSTGATLQGTVTDATGSVVPGVKVELKSTTTGVVRKTVSTSDGIFRFNGIAPAVYDLTVRPPVGFSEYSQTQITLNASEIRELGVIKLTVGAVNQRIEITSTATPVQTASSENSSMVDFEQFKHITVRGRDLLSLMQTLPGVTFGTNFLTGGSSGQGNNETVNPFALGQMNMNGMGSQANFTVDGVTGMDTAGDSLTTMRPNVDAVAEVRVLATNYAAEFGRNIGGQIQVITKSGGKQFHGTAGVNKRHEMFNANSFFNNYNGQPKSFYRFMVETYSIGGPVYIPKVFTKLRNKLFFFVSQEYLGQRSNPASGYANVPNPNQRAGDFSFYPNSQGNFISNSLRNPITGQTFTPWNGSGTYDGRQNFAQYAGAFDAQSQKWARRCWRPCPCRTYAMPPPGHPTGSRGMESQPAWADPT